MLVIDYLIKEFFLPITKSAKKSLKVSKTKQAQNKIQRVSLSKALKNTDEKNVNATISLIDKAAKKNLFHKNKAARMKSALAKKFGTPPAGKTAAKPAAKAKAKVETKKTVAKKTAVKKITAKK